MIQIILLEREKTTQLYHCCCIMLRCEKQKKEEHPWRVPTLKKCFPFSNYVLKLNQIKMKASYYTLPRKPMLVLASIISKIAIDYKEQNVQTTT